MTFAQFVAQMQKDPKFRGAIMKDPAKALKAAKVPATAEQIRALKAVDWPQVERVFNAFEAGMHPDTLS